MPTKFENLEELILKYFNADQTSIDIWQMKLQFDKERGDIVKTDKMARKSSLRFLDERNDYIFKKTFINYLSIGYEARVGFGFDKARSSSRCWNKCIYFWEGMKKNCCTRTAKINKILERFEEIEEEEYNTYHFNNRSNNNIINANNKARMVTESEVKLDVNRPENNFVIAAYEKNAKDILAKDPNAAYNNNHINSNINTKNNNLSFVTDRENKMQRNVIFYGKPEETDDVKGQIESKYKFI